ncbi:unnamed protein product [Cylicocyclus nassatus]|uniref:Uncharacterized protein n=1 Tax=Cylicocyclus nassatus TaxID=53992 RepID=A0AA36GEP7_CYLNA|nr:unnamed protein product [Cylicocyclus nassatus]
MLVEELSNLCGIDGCIFVHVTGFIGGNKAFEGALAMAKKALEIGDAELAARSENEQEIKKMKLDNEQAVSSTEQAVSSTVDPAH